MRAAYALLGLILGIALNEVAHRGALHGIRASRRDERKAAPSGIGFALNQDPGEHPTPVSFTAWDFYDR